MGHVLMEDTPMVSEDEGENKEADGKGKSNTEAAANLKTSAG